MKRKPGPKSNRPNKKTFEQLYYNESISVEELATLYNVKKTTIYNWAAKYKSNK